MSWDVSIQKFSRSYESISDIGDDEKGLPLGPRNVVRRAVSEIFPGTDWTDPAWGVWDSQLGSIEFNVGTDPAESMMLHVRAEAAVASAIAQLCAVNGWQGVDCTSGTFVEKAEHPEEGLLAWTAYRNRVVGLEGSK
jgi:hypothetical protein